jgi:hypothetical protein
MSGNREIRIGYYNFMKMVSSGILRRVDLVITDVSEELSAFIIRVIIICELGTTLAVTGNLWGSIGLLT